MRTKRTFLTITIVLVLAIAMLALVACSDDNAYSNNEDSENNEYGFTITAEGTTDDGFKYQIIDDEYAQLGPYEGELEEVVVPAMVEGKPVKNLYTYTFYTSKGEEYWEPERAFHNNNTIKKVTIPDNMTILQSYSFYECPNLEEVVLPDTITTIEKYAFKSCNNLGKMNLPPSLKSIEGMPPTKATTIILPDGLESIGNHAFMYNNNLEKITIPDSVTHLGSSAFLFCTDLTSVTLGKGLTAIPQSAFYYCINLKNVTLSNSITEIGRDAFSFCSSLTTINLPQNLQKIGDRAFWNCNLLSDITLPQSVTEIGGSAFSNTNLKSIELPQGLTTLGIATFRGCENLEQVILNDSLEEIPESAFEGCISLTNISLNENVVVNKDAFKDTPLFTESDFVIVNDSLIGINIDTPDITIPDGVKTIAYSFEDNAPIENIHLPASLEDFGSIFDNLENLENITIDQENPYFTAIDSVIFSIDMQILYYFPWQKGWTEYTVPEGVKVSHCTKYNGLKEIIFPQSFSLTRDELEDIDGYQNPLDHEALEPFEEISEMTSSPTLIFLMIIDLSNELDLETIYFKTAKPQGVEQEDWHKELSKSISIVWGYENN